mgnify:CR=1 FL=1
MKRGFLLMLLVALPLVAMAAVGQAAPDGGMAPAVTITPVYGDEDLMPLVTLMEFDPWLMVIGSDSPRFVLYNTGQIIYYEDDAGYMTVTLDEDELEQLLEQLDISDDFYALDEYYDLLLKTDQPTTTIQVWLPDRGEKSVGVYGDLRHDPEARELAPETYVALFDRLASYRSPNAEKWQPEKFEALLWTWDTTADVEWLDSFPDLDSPFAVPRPDDQYSIYIDIDLLDEFEQLLEAGSAVELDGRTWAVSMRLPFPHEVVWAGGVDPRVTAMTPEATPDADE